jgi:hypothetical protein
MVNENCSLIVAQGKRPQQLSLFSDSPGIEPKSPYLQIASVPIAERIDPKQNRYVLLILPQRVRAAGAQLTADEAHEVALTTKGWDWSLDKNGRLRCLARLEALLDSICQRSFKEGGEA